MDNAGLNSSFTYTQSYRLFLSVFAEKMYILCKLTTISKLLSRHDKNMDIQKKNPTENANSDRKHLAVL